MENKPQNGVPGVAFWQQKEVPILKRGVFQQPLLDFSCVSNSSVGPSHPNGILLFCLF
jgi:hypothetical protein